MITIDIGQDYEKSDYHKLESESEKMTSHGLKPRLNQGVETG
jgi:hypothetical protein